MSTRKPPTPIEASVITSLEDLIRLLRSRPPLSKSERSQLYEPYFRKAYATMVERGVSYGGATGAPGTAVMTTNEAAFRSHLQAIDNQLAEQVRIVKEGVDHCFKNGEMPAPYYAWRIVVILRKAKQFELELGFLKAYTTLFHDGVGSRFGALRDRLVKAQGQGRTAPVVKNGPTVNSRSAPKKRPGLMALVAHWWRHRVH
jgi:hypothetical protein